MENLFITGGSGTIGRAFIRKYRKKYKIFSYSRNEKAQTSLKRNFPEIEILFGSVENSIELNHAIRIAKPKILIHAAALKHVDTAEKQPSLAIKSNILGSLNVIESAIYNNIKVSIGISTDKACSPDNVYGQSKYLMERMFQEYDNKNNRFVCCRFGNVAWSNGSVLPYWIKLARENKILPVTGKEMSRLIFNSDNAADLIFNAIKFTSKEKNFFILSKKMKKAFMYKLAKLISNKNKFIGLRPGESLHEDLISSKEIRFTRELKNQILMITPENEVSKKNRIDKPLSSLNAIEMTENEMKILINNVDLDGSADLFEIQNY
jgi:UDP-N-acetylglucosamine 4,6-dehydratase